MPVQPGQPWKVPPAAQQNAWDAAAADYKRRTLDTGGGLPMPPISTGVIRVKNLSGATRREGDILGIDNILLDTLTATDIWLEGETPNDDPTQSIGVLLQSTPSNQIDRLQVSGVCLAYVNVTNESHMFARHANTKHVLQSTNSGPVQILYKPSGTGEKLCAVRLSNGGQFHFLGLTTGYGITARSGTTPGTGTVKLYAKDPTTGLIAPVLYNGSPRYETVFNHSTTAISSASTDYLLVHCDLWGVWWVDPTSTSGLQYSSVVYSGNTSGSGVGHSTYKSSTQSAGVSSVTNHEGSLITAGSDYFQISGAGTYTYWYTIAAKIKKTAGSASYPQYGRVFPWLIQDDGTPADLTSSGNCRISMIWTSDAYSVSNSVASQANDCVTFDAAAGDKIYLAIWFQQLISLATVTFQAQDIVGSGVLFKHV